jgi:hypothetical protein
MPSGSGVDPTTIDLFGDTGSPGSAAGGDFGAPAAAAPALTPEQIADARARKKQWLMNQGLDENGNPLPNFGTSMANGGTATGFQVVQDDFGQHQDLFGNTTGDINGMATLGAGDLPVPGENITGSQAGSNNTSVVGQIVPGQNVAGSLDAIAGINSGVGSGTGRGAVLSGQTAQGTTALRGDIEADRLRGQDTMTAASDVAANMNPLTNPALTQTAANQAETALGPAPTIDQGLADRGMQAVTKATKRAGQVVDAALAPVDQSGVQAATQNARSVLDQALNGPDTTARIGAQTLRNQLALARSGATAGGQQAALMNAQAAAPELLAQASDAGIREQQAKLGIASQQTGQLAQTALGQQQNENARLDVAGKAAGVSANAAQGARGQDIDVAKSNQDAASNLLNNVSSLTGQQLNLNQASQELLGRMATDLAKQDFDYSQLDAEAQNREFNRWVEVYGIDAPIAAALAAAAQSDDKGVMDYLMPIIGAGAAALL